VARSGDTVKTAGHKDSIAQRCSPRLAVGVDPHRALQRVGATGETNTAAQGLLAIRRWPVKPVARLSRRRGTCRWNRHIRPHPPA